jgi:hypothetical protein
MVITLALSLLAHVAVSRVLFSHAVAAAASDATGAGFVRLASHWVPFLVAEAILLWVIHFLHDTSVTFCVFSVVPLYSADADRDARSVARDLSGLPRSEAKNFVSVFPANARLMARLARTGAEARFNATVRDGFLLLLGYTALFGAAAVLMHLPRAALLLVGGTAYLAGAVYIGAVWRVACMLSVLEEDGAGGFRALHASDELLTRARKFWAAAAVFTTLDFYAVATQLGFGVLVVDNRMGLGVWLRVAAGLAMAAALWIAVVAGLVAPVVVYFVCKSSGSTTKSPTDVGRKGRATRNRKGW